MSTPSLSPPEADSPEAPCPWASGPSGLSQAINRMIEPLDQILVHLRASATLHRISVLLMTATTAFLLATAYSQMKLAEAMDAQEARLASLIDTTQATKKQVDATERKVDSAERMMESQPQLRVVSAEGGGAAAVLVVSEEEALESRPEPTSEPSGRREIIIPLAPAAPPKARER